MRAVRADLGFLNAMIRDLMVVKGSGYLHRLKHDCTITVSVTTTETLLEQKRIEVEARERIFSYQILARSGNS